MTEPTIVGIDVAAKRPCTCVLLLGLGVAEWLDASDLDRIRTWVLGHRPDVIAIDAPCAPSKKLLSKPEPGRKPYAGRACDRELRQHGIPLYEVPDSREDAPGWMKVGFRLYDAFQEAGYQLPTEAATRSAMIEVYPHASFVTLLGEVSAKKTTPVGRQQRIDVLERHGLHGVDRCDHDALDALAAALTGRRFLDGSAVPVGDPREALLWLPVDQLLSVYSPAQKRTARLQLAELEQLHASLSSEEREELLESLLIAASRGGEAVIKVLEQSLLCHAFDELVDEPMPGDQEDH